MVAHATPLYRIPAEDYAGVRTVHRIGVVPGYRWKIEYEVKEAIGSAGVPRLIPRITSIDLSLGEIPVPPKDRLKVISSVALPNWVLKNVRGVSDYVSGTIKNLFGVKGTDSAPGDSLGRPIYRTASFWDYFATSVLMGVNDPPAEVQKIIEGKSKPADESSGSLPLISDLSRTDGMEFGRVAGVYRKDLDNYASHIFGSDISSLNSDFLEGAREGYTQGQKVGGANSERGQVFKMRNYQVAEAITEKQRALFEDDLARAA